MYKLSDNSKNNLKGVKAPIIRLIERSLAKSLYDFEISDRRLVNNSQSSMSFSIYSDTSEGKYKEIVKMIKEEFTIMQREGHFCTCERLICNEDFNNSDPPHFQIIKR